MAMQTITHGRIAFILAVVVLLAPAVLAAFPEDAPWQLPARKRIIYVLNNDKISDSNNVIVDINIPIEVYESAVNRLNTLCGKYSPVLARAFAVFYASTYNNTQRPITVTTDVVAEKNVTICGQNIPVPVQLAVEISTLDGDTNFSNYQHYIFVYFPFVEAATTLLHPTYFKQVTGQSITLTTNCNAYGKWWCNDTYGAAVTLKKLYSGTTWVSWCEDINLSSTDYSNYPTILYRYSSTGGYWTVGSCVGPKPGGGKLAIGWTYTRTDGSTVSFCANTGCPPTMSGTTVSKLKISANDLMALSTDPSAFYYELTGRPVSEINGLQRVCVGIAAYGTGDSDVCLRGWGVGSLQYFGIYTPDWNSEI